MSGCGSGTRSADVRFGQRAPDGYLFVVDGCGFESGTPGAKPSSHRGLGLDGMRERLLLVGGTLEIESTPGAGTTLFVRIALDGQRSAA